MATTEGWFLAGDANRIKFNEGLRQLVHDMILKGEYYSPVNPEFLRELFFHIDSESWKKQFSFIFDIRPPLPTNRVHFTCSKVSLDWRNILPEGYELVQVDSTFDAGAFEFPEDIKEWTAHSLEEQKARGFGKCLVYGKRIVVWINADCASSDECEIGIITSKDSRLKGLGSATAAAAVEHCLASGFSLVGWHCEDHNIGSIRVAQKVGFVKEREYKHYICMFDETEHFAETGLRHFHDGKYREAVSEFEKGFTHGEVPIWAYIMAARSYGFIGNARKAKDCLVSAKKRGWSNWESVVQRKELQSVITSSDWDEILR